MHKIIYLNKLEKNNICKVLDASMSDLDEDTEFIEQLNHVFCNFSNLFKGCIILRNRNN